jgi:dUTP pyrophosphatase
MLKVNVMTKQLEELYRKKRNHQTDSGFDCYSLPTVVPGNARAFPIMLGIRCRPTVSKGYMLVPRSSITKTPLRLANSVGIIDMTYRGEIQARVDNLSSEPFAIEDMSLFQLVWGDLAPMWVAFEDDETYMRYQTQRGAGGFGSTSTSSSDDSK